MRGGSKSFDTVSIQLVSPASGEVYYVLGILAALIGFHSISFPTEWGEKNRRTPLSILFGVSIQLVSPASGECR